MDVPVALIIIVDYYMKCQNEPGGVMKPSFPEMIKNARTKARLTTRQLADELKAQGVRASTPFINQVENSTTKPTFDFAYSAAEATGLSIEEALRAAFLYRVKWCLDREREALRSLAEDKGIQPEAIDRITSLRSLK